MSRYLIEPATAKDNEALCALCTIPMTGNIRLTLERSPNFFAGSNIQCEEAETYVCKRAEDNRIVGVFSVGKRRVFFQKEIKSIRYFSDLRVHPDAQGSRVLYLVGRFITDNNLLADEVAQTIVFSDNIVMLQQIDSLQKKAKRMSLFNYFPAGNYVSYMVKPLLKKNRNTSSYIIRKAEQKDIFSMQQLLVDEGVKKEFFPYYDFSQIQNDYYAGLKLNDFYLAFEYDVLVGIAGVWDQHHVKQTRIHSYSSRYAFLRPLINAYTWLIQGFTLPPKGTILNYETVHSMIMKDNNGKIFHSLLNEISHDCKQNKYSYFLVGLDEKDELNDALQKFPTKRIIKGKHFLVANKENVDETLLRSLYYLEAARI